jgi:tetratricopeptide (TPR) repeat protein
MERQWSFQYTKPATPNGPLVEMSAAEMEHLLLKRLHEEKDNPTEALWQLARFYSQTTQPEKALEYLRRALEHMEGPEAKAEGVLALGQMMEQMGDFEGAIRFYREAFSLEPAETRTWYFIHNNLGFCLNHLGRFTEGEPYCRKAVEIDPNRPNAYKNLGLSLQGKPGLARPRNALSRPPG